MITTRHLTVRIPQDIFDDIEKLSAQNNKSKSAVLASLLRKGLKVVRNRKKPAA